MTSPQRTLLCSHGGCSSNSLQLELCYRRTNCALMFFVCVNKDRTNYFCVSGFFIIKVECVSYKRRKTGFKTTYFHDHCSRLLTKVKERKTRLAACFPGTHRVQRFDQGGCTQNVSISNRTKTICTLPVSDTPPPLPP